MSKTPSKYKAAAHFLEIGGIYFNRIPNTYSSAIFLVNNLLSSDFYAGDRKAGSTMQEDGSSLELPDVFCSLGSLIVEGRLPAEGFAARGRGYYEGPHIELPGKISRHKCSPSEYLVSCFKQAWEAISYGYSFCLSSSAILGLFEQLYHIVLEGSDIFLVI